MPSSQAKSTSVFHALGSYADRIKEQGNSKSQSSSAATASGTTSPSGSSSISPSPTSGSAKPAASAVVEDDGPWETVRTSRKSRPAERAVVADEKRGSNSRNWRERDEKPEAAKKETAAADEERRSASQVAKKETPTPETPSSKAQTATSSSATATPPKPVWGVATPGLTPTSAPPTVLETPLSARDPVSPSADAGASAQLSLEPASVTVEETKVSKAPASGETSWRAEPKAADAAPAPAVSPAPTPAPAPKPKVAPPPAVNAWDLRKKQMAVPVAKAAVPALQFGSVTAEPEASTSEVKVGKKQKKKTAAAAAGENAPAPVTDTSLWPDINTAVETVKTEDKRTKPQEKKDAESPVVVEEQPAVPGKKQKWKAIPAEELQEAADKAAESSRRQTTKANKQRAKDSEGGDTKGSRAKKGANGTESSKKAAARARSSSQTSEIHLPANPEGQRGANGIRFGTAGASSDLAESERGANGDAAAANGSLSAPMSRQHSQQSKQRVSPSASSVPLSPEQGSREFGGARGSSASPQQAFNAAASLPRPPRQRERDARGGYNGRGRGGFNRQTSNQRMMYPELSPLGTNAELANLYSRGYGLGYPVYPVPPAGYAVAGYDASASTYAGVPVFPRPNMPPPPQPVTQVANLDALRYYVLGQVEYYFSMQNLAMDFFLRQQMDSEGWIEVPMIASFNRIKSLTPDVSIVREVMEVSTLLEVKDDMVRLASGESKRWVLPDAKPCKFGPTPISSSASPKRYAGESAAEISHGIPLSVETASALGIEDLIPAVPGPKFDVEIALMRNAGGNASSSASVLNSDEGKTMTPATSIAGDTTKSDDGEEAAKQQQ